MASGSFSSSVNTSAGNDFSRYIEVKWTSTNNAANNTSTINWTAYSRSNQSSTTSWVYAKEIAVTIAGTTQKVVGSTAEALYKNATLGSGSVTVTHDANGKKSVSVSITAQIYTYGATNSSYSGAITMSQNPVYTLSISAGTGSNITINRTSCAGSGGTGNLSAGTKKLYHGDNLKITFTANSNYSITTRTVNNSAFTSGNTHSVSGNVTVASTATPLKSLVGATDANIGSTSTITITRYNSAYTHTLTYSFGNLTGTIYTKTTNTAVAWTIPDAFYAQIPNAKTDICTITCTTYNGDTSLGTSTCTLTITASSSHSSPSVLGGVKDTNATTTALTGSDSTLVRYKSTAVCTLTATPKNSASISTVIIGGTTVAGTTSDGVTTATRTYTSVSDTSFAFSATDSRGYSTSMTVSPTVIAYVQLTLNPVIFRPTPTGSEIAMTFTGNVYRGSFGAYTNTLTLQYRHKVAGGLYGSWQTIDPAKVIYGTSTYSSSTTLSLGKDFDYRLEYDFQVRAIDGSGAYQLNNITKTINIKRGIPVFDWGEEDFNVNVPLMLNNVNILNVIYPIGAVYIHDSSSLPATIADIGTWTSVSTEISNVYAWKRTA